VSSIVKHQSHKQDIKCTDIIEQLEPLMDRLFQDLRREEDVNLIIKEFAD
jgi:hypothetical protein